MGVQAFSKSIQRNYEIHEWRHACAILEKDFPSELQDLTDVLERFRLRKSWITVGGKNKSEVSKWIDGELRAKGWTPKNFDTKFVVDGVSLDSPTHEVDCFKNKIALRSSGITKTHFSTVT